MYEFPTQQDFLIYSLSLSQTFSNFPYDLFFASWTTEKCVT